MSTVTLGDWANLSMAHLFNHLSVQVNLHHRIY